MSNKKTLKEVFETIDTMIIPALVSLLHYENASDIKIELEGNIAELRETISLLQNEQECPSEDTKCTECNVTKCEYYGVHETAEDHIDSVVGGMNNNKRRGRDEKL